jgi:helix-turn-helix protein
MHAQLTVPMRVPSWALNIDQDQLDELGREDRWLREIEAGEQGPSVPITGEWATVKEVATRHRKSEKSIRRYIKDGALRAHGDKHHPYRVHRDDEIAWIEAQRGQSRERVTRTRGKQASTFRELVKQ